MLLFSCIFILQLYATAVIPHSILISKPEVKDRKVNLALETVLEFNNKDNAADIQFLDNIQKFIGKVRNVIDKNNDLRRDFNSGKLEKFTDFIHNVIEIIYKFEDPDLESFISILSDEIRKYHYRGCKFHELTENYDLRKFIAYELDALKDIPAKTIRNKILAIAEKIEDEQYNKNERDLIDLINSLYRQNSAEKYRKILLNIDDYRLNEKNNSLHLVKIIREGIRSIIFDHYTQLNHNARTALKSKIEEYWMYVMDLSKMLVSQPNAQEIRLRSYNEDDAIKNDDNITKHERKLLRKRKSKSMGQATEMTVTEKTDIYINLNEHIQVKYETPYSKQSTQGMKKVKRMTFMTLYPKLVFGPRTPKYRVADISPTFNTIKNTLILQHSHITGMKIKKKFRVYDYATEATFKKRHKKHSTGRKDREKRTMRQMYVQNTLDLKFGSYSKNKFTTKKKRKHKLTFLTLYPEFDIETSTRRNSRIMKKHFSSPSIRNTMQTLWYEKIKKPYHKIIRSGDLRPMISTDKIFLEVVTMKPYTLTTAELTKKLKYEVNLKADEVHGKESKLSMAKSQLGFDRVTYSEPGVNIWSQPSGAEFKKSLIDITNKNMKFTRNETIVPENRLELLDRTYRRSYGNSLTNIPKDSIVIDKRILTKIQELEKELKNVKTQIINDTKTIKDLKSRVHKKVIYNRDNHKFTKKYHADEFHDEHKINPMKEVVFDLAAQINLDKGLRADFNLGGSKNIASNVINSKSYIRNFHNADSNINKKTQYDHITFKNKNENVESLFQQDKENHKDKTQYRFKHAYSAKSKFNSQMESNQNNNIKQNDNEFHRSASIRLSDNYHSNRNKYGQEKNTPAHKKAKHTFELKSVVDNTINGYSNKMSKDNYDFNRNSFNMDTHHNTNDGLKSNNGVKKIEHNRGRSNIKLFDKSANDHKFINDRIYYKKINKQQAGKQRFELKSFTDDTIGLHYNKMGEQKNNLEQTTFNVDRYRDIRNQNVNDSETNTSGKIKEEQRYFEKSTINRLDNNKSYQNNKEQESNKNINQQEIQHSFKITSLTDGNANIHSNSIHDRLYNSNRDIIQEHKQDDNAEQKRDLNKYNREREKYVDASKYRKEQENKYYSNSYKNSIYELDETKNTKHRERIYDSDLNTDKIHQNDEKNYELNDDHVKNRKNIIKNKENPLHENKTYQVKLYYNTNPDNKRPTSDGRYDKNDQKILKSKEIDSNVFKSQIQMDRIGDTQDSFRKEDKEIYNIMKSSSRNEEHNADKQVFQTNNKRQQNSSFSNEKQIRSGSYLNLSTGDLNSRNYPEKNTFQIVSERLDDPSKDIVRVYDPKPSSKPEYEKKYANDINKGLVTTYDLEKRVSLEGNENIRVFKKHNEIEQDLNEGSSKKNKDNSENKLTLDTPHKKNEVVFKADRNRDIFKNDSQQNSKNASTLPKTTQTPEMLNTTWLKKDLDGDSLNQYYQRAQQEPNINGKTLNKSSDNETLPRGFDEHVHEDRVTGVKENNYTTTLKYENGKPDNRVQKENNAEKSVAVQNITIDQNVYNGNISFKDFEKEKSNTTLVAENSTANLKAMQTKTTTTLLVPTAIRRTFTNVLTISTSSTIDTISPDAAYTPRYDDGVLEESDPFRMADLELRDYGNTQNASVGPMASGLQQVSEKENKNTLSPNENGTVINNTDVDLQRRQNNEVQLYPDIYQYYENYKSLIKNVPQATHIDLPMAVPPGYITPPPDYGP